MNGHQVAPAELEAVLLENEHIADAGVIGVTLYSLSCFIFFPILIFLQWRRRAAPRLRGHSRGFERKGNAAGYRTLDKVASGKIQIPRGRSDVCSANSEIGEWQDSEARFTGMGKERWRIDAAIGTISIIKPILKRNHSSGGSHYEG